jgi:glycosyltransferase involved in cell wall biosynthesis
MIPIKGFDVLLRAFAEARAEVPELTLELAGSGPLSFEPQEGVTFLGRVSPVQPLLERNAIVVVPSRGEGFGMVALEAAERGRAAIVTDVGGLPEIVADGETGLVVQPNGLAAAIVDLARNPQRVRAMGAAARARAVAQFSPVAAVEGVERVYRATADAASSTSRKSNGTR